MSIVSTGIGTDNVEIVVAEILAIVDRPTFIRVGSCGALQPEIQLGDLVISSGAVRLEATTSFFVHDGYPAVADYEVTVALVEAAARLGHRAHVGITATAPGFFGAQGRPIPQLPIRYPDLADELARQRVLNFEMEASAVMVLAGLARCRAGVVCGVFAQRVTGEFVTGEAKQRAEDACVETGLEAAVNPGGIRPSEAGGRRRAVATVDLAKRLRWTRSARSVPHQRKRRYATRGRSLLRQGQDEGRSSEPSAHHHEERQARDPGHVPEVRRQGLQDRRLAHAGQTRGPAPIRRMGAGAAA